MRAPPELVLACGAALQRLMDCKDYQCRAAAQIEYDNLDRQVRSFEGLRKIGEASHTAPLGGVSAQDLTR
jgi:hypothetical protein